jgi:hypothetical protein
MQDSIVASGSALTADSVAALSPERATASLPNTSPTNGPPFRANVNGRSCVASMSSTPSVADAGTFSNGSELALPCRLVDDHALIRWSLLERLWLDGYDVLEVDTGRRRLGKIPCYQSRSTQQRMC